MLVEVGLGVVFALGIAFMAFMLIVSWGGVYWIYTTAIASVVCALALLRGRWRPWAATAGLVVTAVAVAVSAAADLPQEPSPVTALALAVLVGSSVRTLPTLPGAAIATGCLAVIVLTWLCGRSSVTVLATLLLAGGLLAGLVLRVFARIAWPS
ncbi:metal transporter [Actinomadura rubrisoli]|uniref:Metal transporter n=1 Tax=Actinomadura rubrisoli TaxID=2530368 RepID=A0A4R5AZU5_9ACTN|nr:metal transporter [Actinomadura rubrisoli]TDD79158.1 metal transporter [Actinomadura rubrisoli]